MTLDLSCYASDSLEEVTKTLETIRKIHSGLFDERFLLSHVWAANSVHKEIAVEHGLKAECLFLVTLNMQEFAELIPTVAFVLKNSFGPQKLIVLYQNDTLM